MSSFTSRLRTRVGVVGQGSVEVVRDVDLSAVHPERSASIGARSLRWRRDEHDDLGRSFREVRRDLEIDAVVGGDDDGDLHGVHGASS
jgi:hypothetical protein